MHVLSEEEQEHIEEEPPPTTYSLVHKFTFFKPSIQVEYETEDTKQQTINHAQQIFIRGWRFEEKVINVLKLCQLDKLTTLNLWHAGLTDHTFQIIVTFLPSLTSLKTVVIEGNPIPETEPFHKLFSDELPLQHISLRNNKITDAGVEKIGKLLGTTSAQNRFLITLNLAFNHISDEGAQHLANGLRMNRTLISLSLASNQISDKGAQALSHAIKWITLSHEEVVCRRKFMFQHGLSARGSSAPGSRRGDSKDRPGSNRSGSQVDKGRGNRGSSKKKPDTGKTPEKAPKKDEAKGKKGASVTSETPKNKGKKSGGGAGKEPKSRGGILEVEAPDLSEQVHPLLDSRIKHKHGKVFAPGCFTLVNLNLSRNCIGEFGMQNLLQAIKHQLEQKEKGLTSTTIPGLLKLSLQKNRVPHDNVTYLEIHEIMADRDPMKQDTRTPEDDPQSVLG